jgi:hypothetical protein
MKVYLGDAVYAEEGLMGAGILLTTEDGIEVSNKIFLEPEVLIALIEFVKKVGIIE